MKIRFETNNTEIIEAVHSFIRDWQNHSTTIMVQTSGSTGAPKTIEIEKKYMIASARMTGDSLNLTTGQTALLCLSPSTIAGKMMIVRSIVLELELIVTDVVSKPLEILTEEVDFAAMVPFQVEQSLSDLKLLKKLIIGGAPISELLWKRITESNIEAFQTFGMTETISHIAMRKIELPERGYIPLNGVDISCENECLVIAAPHLGVQHLVTNDVVHINKDGSFNWLGRADFVINSGGIKIHPEQIEKQLSRIITQPFFSFGIEDDLLGQKHVLCIEGEFQIDKDKMMFDLENYHVPKEVYFFDNFEYTTSGKINRIKTIERRTNAKKQVL